MHRPVPVESFVLTQDTDSTLQQRIKRQVVEGVLSGRFERGARLPSTRALARHLGISRITVAFAYTDLVADAYLVPRGRSGYYVSEDAPLTPKLPDPPAESPGQAAWLTLLPKDASGTTQIDRPVDWQRYPSPFIYGQPDPTLFDHANWRQCALQAFGQREFSALTADHYERDDPKLIEYLLRQTLPRRGIAAAPENVLLTLGAQNALWVIASLLLAPDRVAVIENPCYPGLRDILRQARCRTIAVDVDAHGLPPQCVPAQADAVFVTASHQCPTTAVMPAERRRALLDLAAERGFVIVEDDYEFDMADRASALPALKAQDKDGAVIYVGSFSKSLFPGLRLGYVVAPAPFIRHARALRATVLRHPPGMIQRTIAYFLALGHYDAQLQRMRRAYLERREEMTHALEVYGLTKAHRDTDGATSFWMQAPGNIDTSVLATRLRDKGVIIEPGAAFFDPAARDRAHYRLAFSSLAASRVRSGIGLIAEELAAMGKGAC